MDNDPPGASTGPAYHTFFPVTRAGLPAFLAWPASSPSQFFWVLVFLAGLTACLHLAKRQRFLRDNPADPWARPEVVGNNLILAVDQNTNMNVCALAKSQALPPVSCMCISLDEHSLYAQCTGALRAEQAKAWVGQEIEVSFAIHVGYGSHYEPSTRIFRFRSAVLHASGQARSPLFELARPIRLEPFQRRVWPRILPSPPHVLGMGLWETKDACPSPASLPSALFCYLPGTKESVRLINISASGICVRLSRKKGEQLPQQCLLFLCLRHGTKRVLKLWLNCVRRHASVFSGRSSIFMGLQVTEWCQTDRVDDDIVWRNTGKSGEVPPLKNWIIRHEAAEKRACGHYFHL